MMTKMTRTTPMSTMICQSYYENVIHVLLVMYSHILLPWLFPSPGVAGIADDLIPPCCPVCRVVLFQTHPSVMSLLCESFILVWPSPFFSPVCQHLTFFSLCAPLPLQSFLCNFLGRLHHSCCPSDVFISDLIPPCHSAHPSQHPHLIYV